MATNVVFSSSSASLARLLPLLLLYSFSLILPGGSDSASDFAECGSALVGLQTCISYVQGAAAAPTPDCCGGLKDVLAQSPRCLCVLIKDRDDPQLPVKINVTRALALPTACSAAANVSKCPSQAAEPAAQLPGGAGVRAERQQHHSSKGQLHCENWHWDGQFPSSDARDQPWRERVDSGDGGGGRLSPLLCAVSGGHLKLLLRF
ncbi:hypothetical protein ZIOFF_052553 [Zingiber officinale]|uniref:Bifunctional inhibitor/plant lipid transfer protein/seed storage helical domain-containing protein n=1 Tax=Zingiber officinale TaxID=94328 RepID=A0A8J5FKE2_ZINOF|nr:hypothetical protein ZIOFF_052553 [Zingiber officinale]